MSTGETNLFAAEERVVEMGSLSGLDYAEKRIAVHIISCEHSDGSFSPCSTDQFLCKRALSTGFDGQAGEDGNSVEDEQAGRRG